LLSCAQILFAAQRDYIWVRGSKTYNGQPSLHVLDNNGTYLAQFLTESPQTAMSELNPSSRLWFYGRPTLYEIDIKGRHIPRSGELGAERAIHAADASTVYALNQNGLELLSFKKDGSFVRKTLLERTQIPADALLGNITKTISGKVYFAAYRETPRAGLLFSYDLISSNLELVYTNNNSNIGISGVAAVGNDIFFLPSDAGIYKLANGLPPAVPFAPSLQQVMGLTADSIGNLYTFDYPSRKIWRIHPDESLEIFSDVFESVSNNGLANTRTIVPCPTPDC